MRLQWRFQCHGIVFFARMIQFRVMGVERNKNLWIDMELLSLENAHMDRVEKDMHE
jgi:hypothetical protein